ncbi:hypothetical protein FSP39_014683 [Pinctada imbricata]|uniref:Uncharacterized protein n=1 Tax=Pinctada imbricata TaxID=66713 RepID=A0AA89BXD8_PINIB|nr:hypothetical protein FSP39_014683 [Pinctada imbricata]
MDFVLPDHVRLENNNNIQTDIIVMDFAKAFDKVPHKRLIHKLYNIMAFMVPDNKLSKEHFDGIHYYIITKPDLQGRLITVNALGLKILGCPVFIDDPKYKRNAYIFNLCLVFDGQSDTNSYEPVVKKLAGYLTQIELQSGFLSRAESQDKIVPFLENLLNKLNKHGSCSVHTDSCTVHLKVAPTITEPSVVQDHDVPVFVKDAKTITGQGHWDLTTQQVLRYIDGTNHVARIAAEADVEINLVKLCLQNLLYLFYFNVFDMICLFCFQYSNMYTVTPNIQKLYSDRRLQEQCMMYCARKVHTLPKLRDIFTLYCSLTHGVTVKDICCRHNPHGKNIDEKKLIQFGLLRDLIRRLHKYPIKLMAESSMYSQLQPLYHWFDGTHSFDEITCKTGLSQIELEEKIDRDPHIVVCLK